jgi:hypothetical protein
LHRTVTGPAARLQVPDLQGMSARHHP